jgi:hypothetical protein
MLSYLLHFLQKPNLVMVLWLWWTAPCTEQRGKRNFFLLVCCSCLLGLGLGLGFLEMEESTHSCDNRARSSTSSSSKGPEEDQSRRCRLLGLAREPATCC